jgi:hypothetical protein
MVRSASEFIIGPRFARTRWRVSNHGNSWPSFETALARLLRMRSYRPVFTLVQSRLMMRCVAGSRAVITNSFASVASSG